jgi:hypothetical protein
VWGTAPGLLLTISFQVSLQYAETGFMLHSLETEVMFFITGKTEANRFLPRTETARTTRYFVKTAAKIVTIELE